MMNDDGGGTVNGFRRLSIFGVMICLVLMVSAAGCKKSSEVTPSGTLLQFNGCKQFLANVSGQMDGYVPGPHEDCIEYQYNGTDTLVLMHINGGFNCEPGEITADIEFNGNVIIITEQESRQAAADCLCLFDIDYEIINLSPGEYTIRIIEPYVESNDQVLEVSLRLLSETSGTYCLPRTYYPWI
jgi:hypothetical protein